MFKESRFSPFPQNMRGRFYELEKSEETRFFEIYNQEYDLGLIDRLKKMEALEDSPLGRFIKLVRTEHLNEQTTQMYIVQTYIADPSFVDSWRFNESIKEYQEFGFASFDELEKFCFRTWNVNILEFVPIEETNIL